MPYMPGMPGMPGPGMPGGFAPYGPPPGPPSGVLPGAVNVSGRPSTDPIRRQCEGNGGVFQDIRPPALSMQPGMNVQVPVQAYCTINGQQAMYDRGAWSPPLTALGCSSCGMGIEPETVETYTHVVATGLVAYGVYEAVKYKGRGLGLPLIAAGVVLWLM